jgi:hypothetical protein
MLPHSPMVAGLARRAGPALLATLLTTCCLSAPALAQKPSKPGEAGAPLGSAIGDVSGWRVEIVSLERGGGMVTATLTLINESDEEMGFGSGQFGDPNKGPHGNVGGIYLIDTQNRQKYLVVRDSDGYCLCSREVPGIEAGESGTIWARFPEPPADVAAVSVVVPHFVPMDDVPIAP